MLVIGFGYQVALLIEETRIPLSASPLTRTLIPIKARYVFLPQCSSR